MADTPELDRQHEIIASGRAPAVAEFIDWLAAKGYHIAHYVTWEGFRDPMLTPLAIPHEQLMADHFGIDRNKIEAERRAILAELAEMNKGGG